MTTIEQQAEERIKDDAAYDANVRARAERKRISDDIARQDAKRIGTVCACGHKHRTVSAYAAHTWYGYAAS